jgi:hypothetical protein
VPTFVDRGVKNNTKYNPWMIRGIMISCQHKRELYLSMTISNDPNLKYYFKILKLLKQPKICYNKLISNSNNKTETTWSIIKTVIS